MAEPKTKEILMLVDDHSGEEVAKAGTVVKVPTDVADALVAEGKADDNAKAVAYYKKQAAASGE